MRRSQFYGLFGGLLLFVFLAVLLHMTEVPYLGPWEIAIEVLGWIVILAGAMYFTRRWLAPALIVGAGFLMTAGEHWTQSLIERGSDGNVFLGMILTLVVNGATLILLVVGLFLMFRGGLQRFFPPQGGD